MINEDDYTDINKQELKELALNSCFIVMFVWYGAESIYITHEIVFVEFCEFKEVLLTDNMYAQRIDIKLSVYR